MAQVGYSEKVGDSGTNLFGIRTRTADTDIERVLQVFFSRSTKVETYRDLQHTMHMISQCF